MIGKDSYRIQAVITKREGKKIEDIAEKEGRSVSNLVALIIRKELKKFRK